MGFDIEVRSSIDVPKHLRKINDNKFWKYAASEWHRLYSDYVPYNSGTLMEQVKISPGKVEHTVPYATQQYLRNNHPRKDAHPKASKQWDKAAEPTQKAKLIKSMQEYVDSGKLELERN